MAGAGSRTRKDGSPSARVGSIERLRPKMLGPSMPTMREVRELGRAADAASPRSKAGRDLAARAASARAARTAFMVARRVEREREERIAGLKAEMAKAKAETDNAYWAFTRQARAKPSAITAADAHRRQRELHDEILGLRGVPKDRTGAKLRKTSDDVEKITGAEARAHVEAPKPALGPRAKAAVPAKRPSPVVREKQVVTTPHGRYQSIAHAGDIHLIQMTRMGKPSGDYTLMRPDGRRLIYGFVKQKAAMQLLEAGHTGRTLARANTTLGTSQMTPEQRRATKAIGRYERIQRGRAQAALTSGPMAPVAARPVAPASKTPHAPPVAVNPDRVRHDYEEHKAARVDRLEERAARLHGESEAARSQVKRLADVMQGQPVLIGHHSEKRHRRDLAKMDAGIRKSVELHREAQGLERRAHAAAHNRAISSDDPAALTKLHEKLAGMERQQAHMAATNRVIQSAARKGQNPHDALVALGHSHEVAQRLVQPDFAGRRGFPDYMVKNNGAEIRRTKERIAQLTEHRAAPTRAPEQHGRHTIEEGGNRVKVSFAGKPSEATRDYMKSNGFRWAPSEGVWQRGASEQAWTHARAAAAMEG